MSLLKAAGQDQTQFTLHTSAVQSELVPQALVMAEGAKNAGVKLEVVTDPADSFWDKTYGHVPFAFSSYGYRPFFAQWLNSFAAYNSYETKWDDAAAKQATKLVYKAAATYDPAKRKASRSRRRRSCGRVATSSHSSRSRLTGSRRRSTA